MAKCMKQKDYSYKVLVRNIGYEVKKSLLGNEINYKFVDNEKDDRK